MSLPRPALSAWLLLAWPLLAVGQEDCTLQAVLRDTAEGATFEVSGSAKPFPDGTLLNVDLYVEGADSPHPVKAATFRVRVEQFAYAATTSFKGQTWAPLVYKAQVQLQVGQQRKGVRDWFLRELGLGPSEQVVLAEQVLKQGSDEERRAFARQTLLDMRDQLVEFSEHVRRVGKAIEKPRDKYDDWKAAAKELQDPLQAFDGGVREYLKARVAWHEQRLIAALQGTTRYLFQVLKMHFDQNNAVQSKRMLERAEHEVKTGLEHVKSRLPKGGSGS